MKLEGIHHITAITGEAQAQRRLLRRHARAADGQEDRQPGRAERLPPLLRGRAAAAPARTSRSSSFAVRPRAAPAPGWSTGSSGGSPRPEALDFWAERLGAAGHETEREGDSLRFSDPEGLDHELVVATVADAAADRRPPRGPRRARAAGLPCRARLLGQPERSADAARAARVRARRATAGRRAATIRGGRWFYDQPPAEPGIQGAGHRPPHRLGLGDGRASRRGASARSKAARARPRSSTASGSGRSTFASRAGSCSRSRPSARASASTRTRSTSARG